MMQCSLFYVPPRESHTDTGVTCKLHRKKPSRCKPEWQSCLSVCLVQWVLSECCCAVFLCGDLSAFWSLFPWTLSPQPGLPSTIIHTCSASAAKLNWSSSARRYTVYLLHSDLQSLLDCLCTRCCFSRSLAFWLLVILTVDLSKSLLSVCAVWPACQLVFSKPRLTSSSLSWIPLLRRPWTESTLNIFTLIFHLNIVYMLKSRVCFLGSSAKPDILSDLWINLLAVGALALMKIY